LHVTVVLGQHVVVQMVPSDRRLGQWDQEFVDSVSFRESPIVAAPDVTEMPLRPDDEFLVIASDGLW
jgi:serine/threonine protein phosphatase PrpC